MQLGEIEFNPIPFNFRQLVVENISLLEPQAIQKNIKLSHGILYDFEVYGDRNMIATVMRNLISNALKFTRQDGYVHVFINPDGNNCEICIQDNGVGISEERLSKLFKPEEKFNTKGTANEKGTGLGLILCKDFVEKNRGTITAKSIPDEGSMFCITLPYYLP